MAYTPTQANISDIRVSQTVGDFRVSWESSDPPGTWFQVYLNGRLAWSGSEQVADVASPIVGRRIALDVLAVDRQDAAKDLSSYLATRLDCAYLQWADVGDADRYDIYCGTAPGDTTPDYTTPVGSVPARPFGMVLGGWGVGTWGGGFWGTGSTLYRWSSAPLAGGDWTFGVKAVDAAGISGPAVEETVTITAPPSAPPVSAAGLFLTGVYDALTATLVLTWQPSTA